MKVTLTVRELLDRDIWDKICEIKGINPWAINEGLMDDTDEITLTENEARGLYLIE